ncbi:MAG TPA: DUF2200 family protein [Bdellovibrionales bacterium]|nr:DUF2200 family protein [Bdellovibrionales bacterium]
MEHKIYKMSFASIYPLYVQKAERKKRTKAEVDKVISWLTGYDKAGLKNQLESRADLETFFTRAPKMNPNVSLITGSVCGVRVEEIKDPLMRKIRYLDKLIDELAQGKALEAILRTGEKRDKLPPAGSKAEPASGGAMSPAVDKFVRNAKSWKDELASLRAILLETKLDETLKWNLPCYSYKDGNVAILQPFKACLALMFFKGSLLKDSKKAMVNNGPNSRAARRFEFRSVAEIKKVKATIKAYVKEAIAIEESGQKVEIKATPQALPAELRAALAKSAALKRAFASLTPGRQRAYILHITGAKQAATREARVAKCIPRILDGKGMND